MLKIFQSHFENEVNFKKFSEKSRSYIFSKVFRETSEIEWKGIPEVAWGLKLRSLAVNCRITQPLVSKSLNSLIQIEAFNLTCLSKHFNNRKITNAQNCMDQSSCPYMLYPPWLKKADIQLSTMKFSTIFLKQCNLTE